MRKILVDAIKGNEILARDIYSDMDAVLMSAGVMLKKEYANKLKALNIKYIYVEDDLAKGVCEDEIIELQVKQQYQSTVKDALQKFACCGDAKLEGLKKVAEDVIFGLLEKPEIIFNMEGVRQKNELTYSHSLNVCALSVFIALRMKLSREKVEEIAVGSLLHDIGFTFVGIDYQHFQNVNITEKELREVKKHVIYGYTALEKEKWLSNTAKNIILSHHERLDGSGYPMHIKGDKISIENKIVAVCDEFDHLVYGFLMPAMKVHEAIEYIVAQARVKYDVQVVQVFNESVAPFPNGTIVLTNEGETGIVLKQNYGFPARPTIRLIYNKNGEAFKQWNEKDLTKDLTTFIMDSIEEI